MVRAVAFAEGAVDLTGASAVFIGPPSPIVQDFEGVKVGDPTPDAHTDENDETMTARVTDDQAVSGKRSLKFIDGPAKTKPYNPHVFYRTHFRKGRMVGRFDLRIDAKTRCSYQWRDYGQGYVCGPALHISEGGKLAAGGQGLLALPTDQWVHIEVACVLGEKATGTFELKVLLPGQNEPKTFNDLPCDEKFRELDWVGFIANGQEHAVFYVDNVEIKPAQ